MVYQVHPGHDVRNLPTIPQYGSQQLLDKTLEHSAYRALVRVVERP